MFALLAFFDTWDTFWVEARTAILTAAGVALLALTIAAGVMRRSIIVAFGTFIVGALLWMLMYNAPVVRDDFQDDLITGAPAAVTTENAATEPVVAGSVAAVFVVAV